MFLFLYLENNLCTILAGIQHQTHIFVTFFFFKETEVKKILLYIVVFPFIIYIFICII